MSTSSGLAANAPDVEADIAQSRLYNHDLAPVSDANRKWGMLSFAALWVSMSACIPTYMLASSLIGGGMNWWQAVLTIFLGNLIVLVPMILNAHAGTKYGIPFPVYCRASFGTLGANVPAILRALVACGWFGIQAWIGGDAIYKICITILDLKPAAPIGWLGINAGQFASFLFFWGINLWVIYRGIDTIRFLLNIKAPLLVALGLLLLWWAWRKAGGFGPMLSQPSAFEAGQPKAGQFWTYFFPALTGMIGFWATLSLNIPDFSRYAKSQRDQVVGQALGLPTTMALYSFIGVGVTSATTVIFGETLWNPVDVLTQFDSHAVLITAMISLCVATLATNIAANVVSPANDFANVFPKKISFRVGGYITGIIGILIMPWKLMENPDRYINWLVSYSALLGPIGGILIADYFVWRKRTLNVTALYQADGEYRFTNGFSLVALLSLIVGAAPSLPGFLVQIKALKAESVPSWMAHLYHYAWFIGFIVAFVTYLLGRNLANRSAPARR
ncbi:MAG TPA: NCS1 family nucleobase:cation symporter-1 [Verrucomicrobiae bacterium]|nr:NCS1 family nucleobase:cation symporter-1 [Verrucomicrobiae bacterium]